ncbi:MAG: hypothetical protein HC837_05355 [Chloroflexaceae bacterium]|nr:hypothetical protein [Chloroflexaceae bacterium]
MLLTDEEVAFETAWQWNLAEMEKVRRRSSNSAAEIAAANLDLDFHGSLILDLRPED